MVLSLNSFFDILPWTEVDSVRFCCNFRCDRSPAAASVWLGLLSGSGAVNIHQYLISRNVFVRINAHPILENVDSNYSLGCSKNTKLPVAISALGKKITVDLLSPIEHHLPANFWCADLEVQNVGSSWGEPMLTHEFGLEGPKDVEESEDGKEDFTAIRPPVSDLPGNPVNSCSWFSQAKFYTNPYKMCQELEGKIELGQPVLASKELAGVFELLDLGGDEIEYVKNSKLIETLSQRASATQAVFYSRDDDGLQKLETTIAHLKESRQPLMVCAGSAVFAAADREAQSVMGSGGECSLSILEFCKTLDNVVEDHFVLLEDFNPVFCTIFSEYAVEGKINYEQLGKLYTDEEEGLTKPRYRLGGLLTKLGGGPYSTYCVGASDLRVLYCAYSWIYFQSGPRYSGIVDTARRMKRLRDFGAVLEITGNS